jgi:hypothetical protein
LRVELLFQGTRTLLHLNPSEVRRTNPHCEYQLGMQQLDALRADGPKCHHSARRATNDRALAPNAGAFTTSIRD